MMIAGWLAGDNSWLVHQRSLTVLLAETSGALRRNGRRSENFAYQYLKYLKGSLTCRKTLRHGTSGFISHPKEGVLRIFVALTLGPVASTLTATPPRRVRRWKFHYRVQKRTPQVSSLCPFKPVHVLISYSFKVHFNIATPISVKAFQVIVGLHIWN
jgi:hypothetical protein